MLINFAQRDIASRLAAGSVAGKKEYTRYRNALIGGSGSSMQLHSEGALSVVDWYSTIVYEHPKLDSPQTIMAWRNSERRAEFINLVVREVLEADLKQPAEDATTRITNLLDRQIRRARRLDNGSSETVGYALSGIMATIGAMIGGFPGASVGGVGAATAGKLGSSLVRRRVPRWAAYFVSDSGL
jgi:hypothetical protein